MKFNFNTFYLLLALTGFSMLLSYAVFLVFNIYAHPGFVLIFIGLIEIIGNPIKNSKSKETSKDLEWEV